MIESNKTVTQAPNSTEPLSSIETLAIVQVTFYIAITIFGTITNVALCGALLRTTYQRRPSECFILNLAFTDLMTCAVGIPLDVAVILTRYWPFGAFLCKVVWPFQTILIAVSVGTLTCMAIERYRAIVTPFKPMFTRKIVKILICSIWCLSIILVTPYVAVLEHKDRSCYESWQGDKHPKIFTMCVFLLFYAIPLSVIVPAYARIGFRLHSDDRTMKTFSRKQGPGNQQFQTLVRRRSKRTILFVKTFLFGAVAFAVCLLPYHVMWLWHDFGQGSQWAHFSDTLLFANALVYFNSLVDPFIFGGTVALNWRTNCTVMLAKCLSVLSVWKGSQETTNKITTRKLNRDRVTLLQQLSAAPPRRCAQYTSCV